MSVAVITGITGQDGSYLAEHLLALGYTVHGFVRRTSHTVRQRIDHLTSDTIIYGRRLFLHYADLEDSTTIRRHLYRIRPDEFYHLAGQTHVGASFEIPESTCQFAAMGTLRLLELLRDCEPVPKFLHVSSSEIFGNPTDSPQNENTPFRPISPYGAAKAFATDMVRIYRDSFGLFACNAICYNHESPRRGESFVTRKITRAAARISRGQQSELVLGNLSGRRDWGFAPDYVTAFRQMLKNQVANDFVLSTGVMHQVRDWLDIAFEAVGLDWTKYVKQDERFQRRSDSQNLVGDSSFAQTVLGWSPQTSFSDMVHAMVAADLEC